jgi:hypothetical protein
VLLHEFTEDEDDPMSTAFKLFDKGCWGTHPLAQPVIGSRRNIERFTREDLVGHVRRHYTGRTHRGRRSPARWMPRRGAARGRAGLRRHARAASRTALDAPAWHGGVHSARLAGSSQSHLVLGFPVPRPPRRRPHRRAWPPPCWARA